MDMTNIFIRKIPEKIFPKKFANIIDPILKGGTEGHAPWDTGKDLPKYLHQEGGLVKGRYLSTIFSYFQENTENVCIQRFCC